MGKLLIDYEGPVTLLPLLRGIVLDDRHGLNDLEWLLNYLVQPTEPYAGWQGRMRIRIEMLEDSNVRTDR